MPIAERKTSNEVNYSVANYSLKEWGNWFRMENRIDAGLGYPKMSAFMKAFHSSPTGGGYDPLFNQHLPDASETCKILQVALAKSPILYLVAQCCYAYKYGKSANEQCLWLVSEKGFYLGATPNAHRIKLASLKLQLSAYITGYIECHDKLKDDEE